MRPYVILLAALVGCTHKEKEATPQDLAPVDVRPDGTPIEQEKSNRPAPIHGEQGEMATIVYVTEIQIGKRGGPRKPCAVIFSSDPDSIWIKDRPRPTKILKPMDKGRMSQLLGLLGSAGLERLPAETQLMDEAVTSERQFVIMRDKQRVTYRQETVRASADLFKVFAACEKVLVDASHEQDPFVETMGRESTDKFKPLNPDK